MVLNLNTIIKDIIINQPYIDQLEDCALSWGMIWVEMLYSFNSSLSLSFKLNL